MLSSKDKKYLLQLAQRTLQKYFQEGKRIKLETEDLSPSLKEKKGVFVTLEENGQLRGCIGNLRPDKAIYQAVIDNSLASALFDPRFPSVTASELPAIKIEVSILSPLERLASFNSSQQLLDYLEKNKPGLLIKKGNQQATFLPQVWEELPEAKSFLQHLCQKAGMDSQEWKKMDLEIYEYKVEKFKQ